MRIRYLNCITFVKVFAQMVELVDTPA